MLDDFLLSATLAVLGVALAAASLGCFVVWRRMACFDDATAHAAILGVALSLTLSISVFAGALIVSLPMAMLVSILSGRGYATDTLLGVPAHSALAFGLVAVSFLSGIRIDLMAYLFGDILAVSRSDLLVIWGGAALVVIMMSWRRSALLTSTLNDDMAYASNINPRQEQMVLTLSLAIVVAEAIKVVGILLIASPAAAARPLSSTPERMAFIAVAIGCAATLIGLRAAWLLDTPAGPSIVCVAAMVFAMTTTVGAVRKLYARQYRWGLRGSRG